MRSLQVGLSETLLAELHSEVTLVWHFQVAKECASFVCEDKLDGHIALEQARFSHE